MAVDTISGKYLVATINGGIIVGQQGWTARKTADQLDGTTGLDGGYENDDYGIQRLEIDMELVQNLSYGVWTLITAGQRITNLRLYRTIVDAQPAFLIPIATIYEATNAIKVRERATVAVKARSNGAFTETNPGAG